MNTRSGGKRPVSPSGAVQPAPKAVTPAPVRVAGFVPHDQRVRLP
jgi:hypothetical protein